MSAKYSFALESRDAARRLPEKIIIGRHELETPLDVALKFLGYVYFYRERLQISVNLHDDSIPFVPDLVQLDYEMRPVLWVECGESGAAKLHKLAVKVPAAEIWIIKPSLGAAEELMRKMMKEGLRRNRYHLLALDGEIFSEMAALLRNRNAMLWVAGDPYLLEMRFDFNEAWFEMPFHLLTF